MKLKVIVVIGLYLFNFSVLFSPYSVLIDKAYNFEAFEHSRATNYDAKVDEYIS